MANVSIVDNVVIELEFERRDAIINIGIDKAEVELTEAQQTMFRGQSAESRWLEFGTSNWEQLSQDSYRLTIPRVAHSYNKPYIAEMQLVVNGGEYENNLRPTYRVSSNNSIIIYSDTAIDCRIKIGGER